MNNHDQTIETENAVTKAVDYAPLYSNQNGSVRKFTFGDGRSIVVSEGNPEFDFDDVLPRDGILMLPDGSVSFASLDGDGAFDPKGDFAWAGSKIDPALMELVAWFLRNGFGAADSASFPANFASNEGIRKALDEASRLFYMADCVGMRRWFGNDRKAKPDAETDRKEAEPVVSENRNEAEWANPASVSVRTERVNPANLPFEVRYGFLPPEITRETVIEACCHGRDSNAKILMDFRSMEYVVKTGSLINGRSADKIREAEGFFHGKPVEVGPDCVVANDVRFRSMTKALQLVTGCDSPSGDRLYFEGKKARILDAYGTANMKVLLQKLGAKLSANGNPSQRHEVASVPKRLEDAYRPSCAVPLKYDGYGTKASVVLDLRLGRYVVKSGSVVSEKADLSFAEKAGVMVDAETRTVVRDADFEKMNTLLGAITGYKKAGFSSIRLDDGTNRSFVRVFGTTRIEEILKLVAAEGEDFWKIVSEPDDGEGTESFWTETVEDGNGFEKEPANAETGRNELDKELSSFSQLTSSLSGSLCGAYVI